MFFVSPSWCVFYIYFKYF